MPLADTLTKSRSIQPALPYGVLLEQIQTASVEHLGYARKEAVYIASEITAVKDRNSDDYRRARVKYIEYFGFLRPAILLYKDWSERIERWYLDNPDYWYFDVYFQKKVQKHHADKRDLLHYAQTAGRIPYAMHSYIEQLWAGDYYLIQEYGLERRQTRVFLAELSPKRDDEGKKKGRK